MTDAASDLSERQQAILAFVKTHGFVATEHMVQTFGVTAQTIRRDINFLCERKLLQRFHGGAGLPANTRNEPYDDRVNLSAQAKRKIAERAAGHIPNGASLFLDIGTTTEALASALLDHKDLAIVTNNINIANILRRNETFEITLAGGRVRPADGGIIGQVTRDFLKRFRLDIGIISISGIDEDGSLLDFDAEEIGATQAIIRNAQQVYLLADHSKFGRRAMVQLGQYRDIDHLFTDQAPPERFLAAMEAADLTLHIADGRTG